MSTHTVEGKFYQFLSMVVELTVLLVTMFGPLTFLAIALLCNLYLLIKPVLHSALTLKPYSKAFAEAREQEIIIYLHCCHFGCSCLIEHNLN
jgi:hypothetical protein